MSLIADDKRITKIGDTPLSLSVYSVKSASTRMNDPGIVEIIFCMKGSVKFGYGYEEFTLHEGDYMMVDRDAFYLEDGKDNICVSFIIDLSHYVEKYPRVMSQSFICEGVDETDFEEYPTAAHIQLKGLMIATLKCILETKDYPKIQKNMDKMTELIVEKFDISLYHYGSQDMPRKSYERVLSIVTYINKYSDKKILLKDIAKDLGLTESYLSEFFSTKSIGFRDIVGYIRANKSEWYLLNTNKTIVEISEECGFSDVKYYYSAFKKWYKCTPRQFRIRYGKSKKTEIKYLDLRDVEPILNKMLSQHYMYIFTEDNAFI